MTTDPHPEEYTPEEITVLQALWGDGFLSPGGEAHLDAIVAGLELRDKLVLDVGCALGGYDLLLARKYGARVIGLDVERPLIAQAQRRIAEAGLAGQIEARLYPPGPLPIDDASIDVFFGKDSWLHIPDKAAFFAEAFRVLKPGGILAAGDWCRRPGPISPELRHFFEVEIITYHLEPLAHYGDYIAQAGFSDIRLQDIHAEYQAMAHDELRRIETTLQEWLLAQLGPQLYAHYIEDWQAITAVLDSGDLRPSRMWARKPNSGQGVE